MSETITLNLDEAPARAPLDTLAKVRLFARVPAEALAGLATSCVARWLDDRGYLFHAGQPADRVYFLGEGQLEVMRRGGGSEGAEVVVNTIQPGEIVGELAVLRSEGRSASVRARGRTLVFGVEAHQFVQFVQQQPEVALAMARAIADGFVRAEQRLDRAAPPHTWGVVGFDVEMALALARAARPHLGRTPGRIIVRADGLIGGVRDGIELHPRDATEPTAMMQVVCLQPGEVAGLARRLTGLVVRAGIELPLLPAGLRHIAVAATGAPSAALVRIPAGQTETAAAPRLARLLLGRSVGVALGGGAARAICELGILEVMESLEIPIDFVTGASMGAAMGAFYLAQGVKPAIQAMEKLRAGDWARMVEPSFFISGHVPGKKVRRFIDSQGGNTEIEKLRIPYAAMGTDVDTGDEHVLSRGNLSDAIMASMAIPGIFPPYVYQPPEATRRIRFVDGGVVNNMPVDVARAMGADRVVGVLPTYRRAQPAAATGGLNLWQRVAKFPTVARALTALQSQMLALSRGGERQVLLADVSLVCDTRNFGFIEMWRAGELIELGRQVAQAAADELRALRA